MPIHLPADTLGVMMIRARSIAMVGVLALFLAACGGGSGESTTTSPTQPQTTTTAVPMEPVQVSYALEAGQTYTFELEMDQTIEFTSTGDSAAIESEDLPGNMTMRVFGPTTVTYQVADGPEPDTYELTITSDLSGLQFDAEVDGAPVGGTSSPSSPISSPRRRRSWWTSRASRSKAPSREWMTRSAVCSVTSTSAPWATWARRA